MLQSWLDRAWPLLKRTGPVFSLLLVILFSLTLYYLHGEMNRCRKVNREIFDHMMTCMKSPPCPTR